MRSASISTHCAPTVSRSMRAPAGGGASPAASTRTSPRGRDRGVGFGDRVRRVLAVRRRIDDQQPPGLVAGHAKRMERACRHVAPGSGAHHFDAALGLRLAGAFDHVGALLQVRMRVRLRAVRLHDRADQHFERRRADGLGADHAHVGGAGVVGRRVGGQVGRPDHGGVDVLHSGWIPAVLTAAAHFAISDFTNARSSSGVDPRLRPPVLENSWRTAGIGERGAQQLAQLRDGVLRRLRGNEGRGPHRHLEALQAGFLQGGHVAQQQLAIGARGGQRAQLAAHHERQRRRRCRRT